LLALLGAHHILHVSRIRVNSVSVEKLKAESKATAESITKETQTAVTKSFNFFSAKGTACRGSICILHK
jgi:hypothetical protein